MENKKEQKKQTISQKFGEFLVRHPISNSSLSIIAATSVIVALAAVDVVTRSKDDYNASYTYETNVPEEEEKQDSYKAMSIDAYQIKQEQEIELPDPTQLYLSEFKDALFYFWGPHEKVVNPRVKLFQEKFNELHPDKTIKVDGYFGKDTKNAVLGLTPKDHEELAQPSSPFMTEAMVYEDVKQDLLMQADQYMAANEVISSLLKLPSPKETQDAVFQVQKQINQNLPQGKQIACDGQLTPQMIKSLYQTSIDTLDEIQEMLDNRIPRVINHHNDFKSIDLYKDHQND